MARVLQKGTEEWEMWQDIFQFRKKYYDPPKGNDEWNRFMEDFWKVQNKYGTELCRQILLAIMDETEEASRRRGGLKGRQTQGQLSMFGEN